MLSQMCEEYLNIRGLRYGILVHQGLPTKCLFLDHLLVRQHEDYISQLIYQGRMDEDRDEPFLGVLNNFNDENQNDEGISEPEELLVPDDYAYTAQMAPIF